MLLLAGSPFCSWSPSVIETPAEPSQVLVRQNFSYPNDLICLLAGHGRPVHGRVADLQYLHRELHLLAGDGASVIKPAK